MIDISQVNRLPFILGGAAFSGTGGGYGFGEVSQPDVQLVIEQAIDLGICAIDLAPIYGFGQAEKIIGEICQKSRERTFLTSKSGVSWHSSKRVNMTNDPLVTEKMLEQSLRDLKTDYIDAYFIHWPDNHVDIRRPMEVLARKKEQGLIRYIGLCNTTKEEYFLAKQIEEVSIIQSEYNIFNNGLKPDLEKIIKEKKIPFWGWGTFDKGIISGSVTADRVFNPEDCRSWAPWWKKSNKNKKIELMKQIFREVPNGKEDGILIALAHAKFSEININPIIGMKNIKQFDQVKESLKSVDDFENTYRNIQSRFF